MSGILHKWEYPRYIPRISNFYRFQMQATGTQAGERSKSESRDSNFTEFESVGLGIRNPTWIWTASGILYPWTGSGKMVHTSTYQCVVVQHGTGQYKNSSYVQSSMFQYIPVQAFNKTCDFPTNPERFRRDKIKFIQLLCIGYSVTMAIFKTTQV